MLVSLPALLFKWSLLRSFLSVYKIDKFGLPFLFVVFCLKYRMIALLAGVLEFCLIDISGKSLSGLIYRYIVRTTGTPPVLL